jgi:cell division protein FtsL
MATLATILRKFDETNAEPRRTESARTNPYQLRALPNEDIFFHTKRVDNSRLVREPDPRSRTECWSTIGAVCALAVVLITSVAPSVAGITAGYQIQALQQERQRLLDERRSLEVDEARLLAPERLERLAKDQHMTSPKQDQLVQLNIKASEGTVAFNVTSTKDK